MISLSKDNRQEELREVVNVFRLVEAMEIKLFRDTLVCPRWYYNMHGPFTYVQSLYFLAQTIKSDHSFDMDYYPSVQRFQVKRPTRSDPCLDRVTKLDEMDVSENESSSSIVASSTLNPFHQDLVTSCKTLLKASEESTQSMIASETEPCSRLGFNHFLWPGLDRQVLLDFQDCIEDETRNKKHQYFEIGYCSSAILPESKNVIKQAETLLFDCFEPSNHSRITELLQQASTRVLFLYSNILEVSAEIKNHLNLI
eukprot:scaffold542499_cov59-Attheya_sp.AAC.1